MSVHFSANNSRFPLSRSEKVVLSLITLTALAAIGFGGYGFIQRAFTNTIRIASVVSGGAVLALVLSRLSYIGCCKHQSQEGVVEAPQKSTEPRSLPPGSPIGEDLEESLSLSAN